MLGAVLWFDALILFFYTCFHYMTCTILWCYVPCDVVSVSEAMHTAVRQPADVPTNLWWGKLVDTRLLTGGSHRYTVRRFHLLQLQYFDHLLLMLCPCLTFCPPAHDVFSPKLTHCSVAAMLCIFRAVRANISWKCLWHCACPRAADVTAVKCHTLIAGPSSIFFVIVLFVLEKCHNSVKFLFRVRCLWMPFWRATWRFIFQITHWRTVTCASISRLRHDALSTASFSNPIAGHWTRDVTRIHRTGELVRDWAIQRCSKA